MNHSFLTRLRKGSSIIALCSSAIFLTACDSNSNDDEQVHDITVSLNTGGAVEGLWYEDEENGPREFLGVPYATPPINELRFTPPQAVELDRKIDAKAFGPSCVQNPGALSATGDLSEDCLSLNIFTPAMENDTSDLPVMVWIHGGAFLAGGSNQYDAINLAKDNAVIVVTLNYRLGALGFFSHSLVDTEQGSATGNLGLQDQQLALEWVKENISEFGGDSDNITLFGESAGSMSTCIHIIAPESQDLVDRFILQSGVCAGGGLPILPKLIIEGVSSGLIAEFCADDVDQLACLRTQTAEDIMAYGSEKSIFAQGWGPTIIENSPVLPDSPTNLIEAGEFNQGGIIIGTNQFEWSLFQSIGASPSVASITEFDAYVDFQYGANAAALKVAYAPPLDDFANIFLSTLITDQVFRCPARSMANLAEENGAPVWLYSFEQDNPAHAFEIPYVFNYVSAPFGIDPTNSPTKDVFQAYWTTFATEGDPNDNEQPYWARYDSAAQAYMIIKDSPESGLELSKDACDLWDSFN